MHTPFGDIRTTNAMIMRSKQIYMGKNKTSVIKSFLIFKGNMQVWNFFWCIQLITCWKLVRMLKKEYYAAIVNKF